MSEEELTIDPLYALRDSILAGTRLIPVQSADSSTAEAETTFSHASYLVLNHDGNRRAVPLDISTRFESNNKFVNFRSIYFAWVNRDLPITDYIAKINELNEELQASGKSERVQNLVFAEKLDLITWLEGTSDESEHIRIPQNEADQQAAISRAATGFTARPADGIDANHTALASRDSSGIDIKLREIINGERRMGDRNTVLRGIKPTDFSHVHKFASDFLGRARKTAPASAPSIPTNPALRPAVNPAKPNRRPEPIILLSPSASSLLRMSNIKSFLDGGVYEPPDSSSSDAANILHVMRSLPSIEPARPMRFILVDSPDMFKPDYWARVAAVFSTGQIWQFKSYKWQSPPDLFSHALGVYVGWRGEEVPSTVKGWGRGVISVQIEKWNPHQPASNRWRDREVVEGIWTAIEDSMRAKGWTREGPPAVR